MIYKPHNYQSYCIQRIVTDPAVGLFLRPGLGKTSITLTAINMLKYYRWSISKALVVAPEDSHGAGIFFQTNQGIKYTGRCIYHKPRKYSVVG